jgi:hypothetical protein
MSVPNSEVGYTSATTGRGDHEVHDRHVVALDLKITIIIIIIIIYCNWVATRWQYREKK